MTRLRTQLVRVLVIALCFSFVFPSGAFASPTVAPYQTSFVDDVYAFVVKHVGPPGALSRTSMSASIRSFDVSGLDAFGGLTNRLKATLSDSIADGISAAADAVYRFFTPTPTPRLVSSPTVAPSAPVSSPVSPAKLASGIAAPTQTQLIIALRTLLGAGLPPDLSEQLRGPKGDTGAQGLSGPAGMSGGFVYASANNPNGAGTIGGVTYFGAKELTTETFTATGASSLASLAVSGTTTLSSLAVSGVSALASVSASALYGPAFEEDCSGLTDKVLYNAITGHFSCGVDLGSSGGGGTLAIRESGNAFTGVSSLSFGESGFNVSSSGALSTVALDYTNGPASRAMANTWTASNAFNAGASVSGSLELVGYASVSGDVRVGGDILFDNNLAASNISIRPLVATTGNSSKAVVLQANVNSTSDTDSGAAIELYTDSTGATNSGRINLIAYGQGTGPNANAIRFFTRSGANAIAERMRVATDGSIGIGTGAPTSALHIVGDTATLLNVASGSNSRLVVLENGNVGVGTGTPSYKVDVTGTLRATSYGVFSSLVVGANNGVYLANEGRGGFFLGISQTPSGAYPVEIRGGSATTYTDGYIRLTTAGLDRVRIAPDGNVGIGTTGPTSALHIVGDTATLLNVASGSNSRLVVLENGNVGVGTAAPTAILHTVATSLSTSALFERTSASTNSYVAAYRVAATTPGDMADGFGPLMGFNIKDSSLVDNTIGYIGAVRSGADGTGDLIFVPNTGGVSNERMRIKSDGNVGIGTGAPTSALHIVGDTATLLNVASGSNSRLVVLENGNVGIGTTAPNTTFEVAGTIRASRVGTPAQFISIYSTDANYFAPSSNANTYFYQGGNYDFVFTTSALPRMRLTGGGNLGIGASGPEEKLEVAGNILASASSNVGLILNSIGTGADEGKFTILASGAAGVDKLLVRNGARASLLAIASTGYVGIGRATPAAMIDVLGSVANSEAARIANGDTASGGGLKITVGNANNAGDLLRLANSVGDIWSVTNLGRTLMGASMYVTAPANTLSVSGAESIGASYVGITAPADGLLVQGNVGIGSTTPEQKLEVAGNILASSSSNTSLTLNSIGTEANAGKFTILASGAAGVESLLVRNGTGTSLVAIASNGNVGIGTTTPAQKLQIVGGNLLLDNSTAIYFKSAAGVAKSVLGIDSGDNTYIDSPTGGNIYIRPSNGVNVGYFLGTGVVKLGGTNAITSPYFYISSTGNTGIGATSPEAKLDVAGNIIASSSSNTSLTLNSIGTGADNGKFTILASGAASVDALLVRNGLGANLMVIASNGNITMPGTLNAAGSLYGGSVQTNTIYDPNFNYTKISLVYTTGLTFSTGTSSAIERMRIDTAGNVGIGATSPEQKLEVAGNIFASASGNVALTLRSLSATGTDGQFSILTASTSDRLDIRGGAGTLASTFMSIASTGNVGIGTTTPAALLDIAGTSGAYYRFNRGDALFDLNPRAGGNDPVIRALGGNLIIRTLAGQIAFQPSGTATKMLIDTTGNIGIGTTGPEAKLDVTGNILASTSGAVDLTLNNAATTYGKFILRSMAAPAAGRLEILGGAAGTTTFMSIASTGNVGIGITTPGYLLDVNGIINASQMSASGLTIFSYSTVLAQNYLRLYAANGPQLTGTSTGNLTIGNTVTPTIMYLDRLGNVGIGATTPEQKLEVAGSIIASTSANAALILNSIGAGMDNGKFTILASGAAGVDSLLVRNGAGTTIFSISSAGSALIYSSLQAGNISGNSFITNKGRLSPGATDGILNLLDYATATTFSRLNFGSGTSLFPALSVTSAATPTLNVVAGDGVGTSHLNVSGNFTGSGLTSCTGLTAKLTWSAGQFGCGVDQTTGGGGGTSSLEIREFGAAFDSFPATASFDPNAFNLVASGSSDVSIKLDWTNGPASRSMANTWTALNTFSAGATISGNFEVRSGTASLSNALYTTNGNVGIGTTNPTARLTLANSNANVMFRMSGTTAGTEGLDLSHDYGAGDIFFDSRYANDNGDIIFRTKTSSTPVYAMTIKGSGNIGIGASGPEEKLEVAGNILASASSNVGLILNSIGAEANAGKFMILASGAAGVEKLLVRNAAGTTLMSIASTGYLGVSGMVGIGSSVYSQTQPLQIGVNVVGQWTALSIRNSHGAAGDAASIDFNVAGSTAVTSRISSIRTDVGAAAASDLIYYTFGPTGTLTEKMRIMSTGNVGIGIAAPTALLHVSSASDGAIFKLTDSTGTCSFNPDAGSLGTSCSSDIRLKSDIGAAPSAVEYLKGFRIHQYTVTASGKRTVGVIAQELRETYPDLVASGSYGMLMVQQPSIWVLVHGIQELASKDLMLDELLASSSPNLTQDGPIARVAKNIVRYLADVMGIELSDNTVKTGKLCLGNECITETELHDILQQRGTTAAPAPTPIDTFAPPASPSSATPTPDAAPTPDATVTPDVTPTPDATPTPTDVVMPADTPTPTPAV